MHTKITNINCLWLINENEANHSIKNKVACERYLWGGGGGGEVERGLTAIILHYINPTLS